MIRERSAAGPTGPTGSTCSVAQAVTILDPSILSLPSRYSSAYLTRRLTQPDAGPVETRAVCYETCEVRKVWPDWRGSRGRRRACDAAVWLHHVSFHSERIDLISRQSRSSFNRIFIDIYYIAKFVTY